MPTEIERKFLVVGSEWRTAPGVRFVQGYLNREEARTVRVRIAGNEAYLTVKGRSVGASRAEFEYAIPIVDAEQLLQMCDGPTIHKLRRVIVYRNTRWEVDEFFEENAGLVVAEVELETEGQPFDCPSWLGDEVTGDFRYFNSQLSIHPYRTWGD
jgi:adenylate cyclase